MKALILAVFVAFCNAATITLPDLTPDDEPAVSSGLRLTDEAGTKVWSREEYMRDFRLAAEYMRRGYMKVLAVSGSSKRRKRDRDEELTKCGDLAGGVAGFLGVLSVIAPNPVTPVASAAAGSVSAGCILGKYIPNSPEPDSHPDIPPIEF